jgi:hypothetical protein
MSKGRIQKLSDLRTTLGSYIAIAARTLGRWEPGTLSRPDALTEAALVMM